MSGPTPSAVFGLLSSQISCQLPEPTSSFEGQTAIVTGANAGLGREVVKHLVKLGASRVILAVRNTSKGEAAVEYVKQQTGRGSCMEVWQLDMSSFESVKGFAKRAAALERLDVVVANAGMWPTRFDLAEGYEATVTVNVISTFLLVRLLLPKMQATASKTTTTPRITVLTSTLHKFATFPARKADRIFEELRQPVENFDARYNDTKLLVMLYGEKLADSLSNSGELSVCLNFVCPGWCVSNLKAPGKMMEKMAERMLARPTDDGARVIVDAVVAEKASTRHGAFVSDMKVKNPAAWLGSKEGQQTAARVWTELNEILNAIAPELAGMDSSANV